MRQDVYRSAYEEVSLELTEVATEFERLRIRKDQLEKVRDSLKQLAESAPGATAGEVQAAPQHSYTY
jgi:hypothetical protein